jgi:hypothetical protein
VTRRANHPGSDAGTLGTAPQLKEPRDTAMPFVGVFMYLITQGGRMAERKNAEISASRASFDEYVRNGPSDQIAKGKELLDSGAIDQAEFELLKRKALA